MKRPHLPDLFDPQLRTKRLELKTVAHPAKPIWIGIAKEIDPDAAQYMKLSEGN
jgi:hypothetical protein